MERKGLISKSRDLDNKNLVAVTLTDKGKGVYKHILSSETIHDMFSALSNEQHQQLMKCLDTLWGKAHDVIGVPKPQFPYT